MRKRLSFFLAIVFILTLAFSIAPIAGATCAETKPPEPGADTDYGTLTVTKGQAPDSAAIQAEQEFTVYVSFRDNTDDISADPYPASTGTYEKLATPVDIDGVEYQWKLSLSVGEFVRFVNINEHHCDTNYFRVFEQSPGDDWTVTYSKSNGDGHVSGMENEACTVYNKYAPSSGTLEITKEVTTENAPAAGVAFPIRVQFTLPEGAQYLSIANNGGLEATENGDYQFPLEDGASIIFSGLPTGTTYTVTEPMTEQQEAGWHLDAIEYSGDQIQSKCADNWSYQAIDFDGDSDTAVVKNTYTAPDTGSVELKKLVTGDSGELNPSFTIHVTFSHSNPFIYLGGIKLDGSAVTFNTGTTTVSVPLVKDQTAVLSAIPAGTTYVISEETSLPDGYTHNPAEDIDNDGDPYSIDEKDDVDKITVTNHYNVNDDPPPVTQDPVWYGTIGSGTVTSGTLTIDKIASGADASVAVGAEPFSFTVTFTGNQGSLTSITNSLGLTGTSGVYTFTLTADAPAVVFSNIPVNTGYDVTETILPAQDTAGWKLDKATGASGTITGAGATAVFENILTVVMGAGEEQPGETEQPKADDQVVAGDAATGGTLPQTGGLSESALLGILGLALIAVGGTLFVILRKRFLS